MTREELQKVHDALSLLNSMVNCGDQHSSSSVNMTQAAFAILRKPLLPAEGAEEILPTDNDIAIEIVARFTANPHPNQRANYEREKKAFANGAIYVRELAQRFLPLHAQRLAEKMVSERLREELIGYDKFLSNTYWGISHIIKRDEAVDEYLKSRESHE